MTARAIDPGEIVRQALRPLRQAVVARALAAVAPLPLVRPPVAPRSPPTPRRSTSPPPPP